MSGKRQASYTIDPNTLQEKEKDQDPQSQTDGQPRQKGERKIFKIKRPGQNGASEQGETKVAFKLNESQQFKPSGEDADGAERKDDAKEKEVNNPFANLFRADKNIFNGIGIFSNANSMNLFTSNKGTQESAKSQATSSGSSNLFVNNNASNTGKTIFNNGLTSLKGTGASLFQQGITPNVTTNPPANNDDDGSGDSAQLQEAQNIECDPSKSKENYNYDDSCPVLLTLKASKFKKVGSDLIENVEIVLQKQKQNSIKYITVRLPVTKKSIFSGVLVDKRSEVKHINGKKQNVEVTAFVKEKEGFVKVLLKFQFQKEEDGEKLFERLQELLLVKEEVPAAEEGKEKKQ